MFLLVPIVVLAVFAAALLNPYGRKLLLTMFLIVAALVAVAYVVSPPKPQPDNAQLASRGQ